MLDLVRVAAAYAPGASLLRSWELSGGISAQMIVLELALPGGAHQRIILRRPGKAALQTNPRAAWIEYQVLRLAREAGLPVPAPYLLNESEDILPGPYLLLEYKEGEACFRPAEPVVTAVTMAGALARVHKAGDSLDLSFLPSHAGRIERSFSAPPDPRAALYDPRLHSAWASAVSDLRAQPVTLLHGDFWPGNLLWQGSNLTAVIDWEDAARGDPLFDLAIARLDLFWIYGPPASDAFTCSYSDQSGRDLSALPAYDLWAALRLARMVRDDLSGWAAFFKPYGRLDITPTSIDEHYRRFVERALAGKV